jgi:hypothetical protein
MCCGSPNFVVGFIGFLCIGWVWLRLSCGIRLPALQMKTRLATHWLAVAAAHHKKHLKQARQQQQQQALKKMKTMGGAAAAADQSTMDALDGTWTRHAVPDASG